MIAGIKETGRLVQVRAKILDVNAFLILQDEYTVILDSLLLPKDSQKLSEIAASYGKPVKYLINTHFHSDHCFGNRYLKQSATIQINQKNYWNTIINERAMINPRHNIPLDRTRLTLPDITFEEKYKLDDIRIIHTPGHSPDSSCIYLPSEKVLIAGDTIINNTTGAYSLPYFYWGSAEDLISSLQKLLELDISTIYSGHGYALTGKEKIYIDLDYLRNLVEKVNNLDHQNLSFQEIAQRVTCSSCLNSRQKPAVPQVHELNIRQLLNLEKQSD